MAKLSKEEIEQIKKEVAKEFPCDTALQQLHIARKILSREATKTGLSIVNYVISLRQKNLKSA